MVTLKEWEPTGNSIEVAQKHQILPQTLYRWKKAAEQRAQVFLSGRKSRVDLRIRKLETENRKLKEAFGSSDPGIEAFKRRDELGLTKHAKGTSYSSE